VYTVQPPFGRAQWVQPTVWNCEDRCFHPYRSNSSSLLQSIQTLLGFILSSIQWTRRAFFYRAKRLKREANHSPPFNTEFNNAWRYNFTPKYGSWSAQEKLYFSAIIFINMDMTESKVFESSCLYRASMTIKTFYYPKDAQIYNS